MVVLHIKFEVVHAFSLRGFEPPKLRNNLHIYVHVEVSQLECKVHCMHTICRTISKYVLHVNLLPDYNMHKKSSRRKCSFAQTSDDTATCELCYGRHIL